MRWHVGGCLAAKERYDRSDELLDVDMGDRGSLVFCGGLLDEPVFVYNTSERIKPESPVSYSLTGETMWVNNATNTVVIDTINAIGSQFRHHINIIINSNL